MFAGCSSKEKIEEEKEAGSIKITCCREISRGEHEKYVQKGF